MSTTADRDVSTTIAAATPSAPLRLVEPRHHRSRRPRVSIVVPTYNEERNVGWVLGRLPADLHEVIIIDGRSTDATVETALRVRPDARILRQRARGKGAALAMGLAQATGDIAVMIDADGSMDPAEIPALIGALLAGADVVKGSRATSGGGSTDLTLLRRLGNWSLTFLANRLYRQSWRELCYGYAAYWTDVIPALDVAAIAEGPGHIDSGETAYGHGFEIEAVLFCRAARAGLRVAEVFSYEHDRRNGESNLHTWRDGWRVLTAVLKERRFRAAARVQPTLRNYPILPELYVTRPAAALPAAS
ncbi:MAG: glycosyltransferase family 2 protein [Dehalococcoidia bacterium]